MSKMSLLSALVIGILVAVLLIMPITSALIGVSLATVFGAGVIGMMVFYLTFDKEFSYLLGIITAILLLMFFSSELNRIWNHEEPFAPFSEWNNRK